MNCGYITEIFYYKLDKYNSGSLGIHMKNNISAKLSAIAISVLLASCGGGGSDGYYGGGNTDGGTGGGTGEVKPKAVNMSAIELLDPSNKATRSVTIEGATAKVKVTDEAGAVISGALVTFTSEGVTFGTSNGAVLTNAEGIASISLKPTNTTDTGSYQLTATVVQESLTATTTPYNFSVQAANITFVDLKAATTQLDSGASTLLTLKTQDVNTKANQNNVTVNFTATCGTFDYPTVVSSNQGDVATTYKGVDAAGKLCAGAQTITATGSNTGLTKTLGLTIAAIQANSLVYSTAGDVQLVTKNSGSAASGQIEFTVYANGSPASNEDVQIDLVRGPTDLSFVTVGNRTPKVIKSDATGKVVVSLHPGTLPGPVEIKATLVNNSNVYVLSKNVAVATGRVSQQGLSLSATKYALMGDMDGDTTQIVARLADRVGNPVPNGTTISFISEGGSITPNCSTQNGQCSVTLTTQNPRPALDRVTVMAYVEGDKAYTDVNKDNSYTAGIDKLLTNIGDFFRDDNEDNKYNEGEFVYKRGATGTCTASTFINSNIADTCDTKLDAILRYQMLFGFAEQTPTYNVLNQPLISTGSFVFQLFGNNTKTVPMPTGTILSVVAKDLTENSLACEAEVSQGSLTIGVRNLRTPSTFADIKNEDILYKIRLNRCEAGDVVRVRTVSPAGKTVTTEFPIAQ